MIIKRRRVDLMNIQITGNELINKMLNDWYRDIRAQRISEAKKLKERDR